MPKSAPTYLGHIKGLLFDKDGTLIDFERTWAPINIDVARAAAGNDDAAFYRVLAACGYDIDSARTEPGSVFAVAGLDDTVAFISDVLDGAVPVDLRKRITQIYAEGGKNHAVLIDGVAESITALRQRGYHLGVATNDTEAGLIASLGRCGLLEPFCYHAGCDSGYGAKPDPGMVLGFAAATGLQLSEIAMIGDSTHDMETALRAGPVFRIAVLTGTGTRKELSPAADLVVDHISALLPLLASRSTRH